VSIRALLPLPETHRRTNVAIRSLEDARDLDLVRRVRTGDEDAFRALFRRYGPVAKALAVRVVRQPFLAEEIVQEAFLALWRAPAGFREELGTFRAWLLSAVHHRSVDMVRREEAQRRRSTQDSDPEPAPDVGETVVEEINLGDTRERVRGALGELPDPQRQVIEMMYFQGKSQSTISAELGLPLGTVKSRTLLGMRRLRESLVVEER
jgi:RNA polymerase sigma-70 factor (ECF subfamily)